MLKAYQARPERYLDLAAIKVTKPVSTIFEKDVEK